MKDLPTADRWQTISDALDAVLDAPPDERPARLDEICEGDEALRRQVETFLQDEPPAFLDAGAAACAAPLLSEAPEEPTAGKTPPPGPLEAGDRVGSYRITAQTGRGGMSTVYRAERTGGPFERTVAVKVLRRVVEGDRHRRFRVERQILASLQHPSVAQVFDGGVTDGGQPYLVMEFVEGRPLTAYCDTPPCEGPSCHAPSCSLEERLALFERVGEAVQHAHENFVVHRDLKPANILVTADGQPKLLDFGVAKLLDAAGLADAPITRTGGLLMTPAYAAPEQVRGEDITTATDVHALGVLLYELLAGARPFQQEGRTSYAVAQAVCEETPPLPSEAAPDGERSKALRGDLDAIIMKALRKEPGRRYPTVQALLDDLRAYRDERPVTARRGAWAYRTKKFAQRHRWGMGVAAAFVLLTLGFAAFYVTQIQQERDRAQAEAAKAERVSSFMVNLFEASDPAESQGDTLTARQLLARGEERVEKLDDQPLVQAQMLDAMGRAHRSLAHYDTSRALLRRSLTLRRDALGPDHPDVAESLDHLADAFAAERDYESTVPLYREALAIRRQSLGKNHLKTAETLDGLSRALRNMDQPDSAVTRARRALDIRRRWQDSTHPDVIGTEHTLAYALRAAGKNEEAAARYRTVLRRKRAHDSTDRAGLAGMHNDFAFLLMKQERYAASERHYRKAIAISRSVYGPVHPRTMTYRKNLAGTLMEHGKHAGVEQALRDNLEALRTHAPSDSARLRSARAVLAQFRAERGRFAGTAAPLRAAYRHDRAEHGKDNIYTVCAGGELGAVLKALGRDPAADALLERTYTHLQAVRDSVLQHRDSYVRLDTQYSLRFMVTVFKQADLPDLADRFRTLRKQYTLESGS